MRLKPTQMQPGGTRASDPKHVCRSASQKPQTSTDRMKYNIYNLDSHCFCVRLYVCVCV